MARAVVIVALLAALVLIVNAARNCYLLPSSRGKCIYVLRGAEKDKCLLTYAGSEYIPFSEQDMEEIRKVLYWNDINDKKVLTGLRYIKHSVDDQGILLSALPNPKDRDNLWEKWKNVGISAAVELKTLNFQAAPSKNEEQVVMELGDDKVITYTMTDTTDLPLLCMADRRPALPCPTGYEIYRPTKRCFKVHKEIKSPIDAEKICKSENAIMGSINNKEEDDYIGRITNHDHVYLGMRFAWKKIMLKYKDKTDKIPKGKNPLLLPFAQEFMYNLDGHHIVYINFEDDQPDFETADEFFIVKRAEGKWHDYPRSQHYLFFCATLPDQTGQV